MQFSQWQERLSAAIMTCFIVTLPVRVASAHFLFATSGEHDGKSEARLHFSEGAHVEADRLPGRIAESQIWLVSDSGKVSELSAKEAERSEQPLLVATLTGDSVYSVEATCQYGVYQTFLLTYYAKHVNLGDARTNSTVGRSKKLDLDVEPRHIDKGLQFTVFWKNKPLPNANVVLTGPDEDETEATTGKDGTVTLKNKLPGLYAVRAHHIEKDLSGELGGKEYESGHHYSTLTLNVGKSEQPVEKSESQLPTLLEAVSSFGAVASDGWLYVYSGHTGKAHDHSKDNLSKHFRRVPLSGGDWEELPAQTPLQGLAIVAHDGLIYRIGGMTAHNAADADADLHSSSDFACFDPSTKKWRALPSLPAGRSSHDAVVIDGKIYVAGGWCLSGSDDGGWQSETLVFDLSDSSASWQLIKQPFERRALATGHLDGDLVVIGGMNADHEIERTVNVYSPASGEWSKVADLPGEGMNGFGVSAWNIGGRLFVSGSNGIVYRLSNDRENWENVSKLKTPRFFHQFVPSPDGELLAVGGASMRAGHLQSIEQIEVSK